MFNHISEALDATIVLHHDYPKKPPLILLSFKDSSSTVNAQSNVKVSNFSTPTMEGFDWQ